MSILWRGLCERTVALLLLLAVPIASLAENTIEWRMLMDQQAQIYEDPYRDLSLLQMQKLMELVALRQSLLSGGEIQENEIEVKQRADAIERELGLEGLDANWILSQREVVADRRRQAALATNGQLEGSQVEIYGYFLHAKSLETGEGVAYLVPSRGVCMHLPAPQPNQIIRLEVQTMPDPVGPCIAALMRGRLSVDEVQHTIPSADGSTPMWSRWKMDVTELSTTGKLPSLPKP